jgi:hypothetical protein
MRVSAFCPVDDRLPQHGVRLFPMARLAEHLALRQLALAFFLVQRPDVMRHLLRRVDVIELKVLSAATLSARAVRL